MPRAVKKLVVTSVAAAVLLSLLPSSIAADDNASRGYEDALRRFEKNDTSGAIVQLKNALQQDPQMLAAHILIGRAYLANSQPDAAQESFERALRLGVDPSEIAIYLSQAYLNQGKSRELLERFPPESVPSAQRAELLVTRGQAYRHLNNSEAAARSFTEARNANPRFVSGYLAHADLLSRQGKAADAMKLVDSALAIDPASARAWYLKGSIYNMAGDLPAALENYGKALSLEPAQADARVARVTVLLGMNRDAEVAQDIEHFKRYNPKEPRANYLRSIYFNRRGDRNATHDALADIVAAVDPIPAKVLTAQAPDLLFIAGLAHHGLNQYEEARRYLERFLQVNPGHVAARKLLGSILIAQRDYAAAVNILEQARIQAPWDPQVLALLANASAGRGQAQLATRYLEQALELSRSAPDIQATLGLNLVEAGQQEAGLRHLEAAYEKRQDAGMGAALTVLYLQRGENRKAAEVAQRMVQREPKDSNALNLFGVALAAAGDPAGARAAYERALKVQPKFKSARMNLGRLEASQGNDAAARERFMGLLKEQPKDVQAMYELARLEDGVGRTDDAIRWLEKARGLDRRHVASAVSLTDIYLRAGQPGKALDVAKDIDAVIPANVETLSALSRAQAATRNQTEAQAALDRLSRLAESDAHLQLWIARMQLSVNNPDGALRSLSAALTRQPDYPEADALLCDIELGQGKLDAAETRAKAVAARHPELGVGHRLLADVATARGRTADGLRGYQKALSKEPTTDMAVRLYRAYMRSGDLANAVQLLQGWVRDHPGDPVATRALAEGYLRAGNLAAARQQYESLLQGSSDDPVILNNLANVLAQQGDPKALELAEQAHRLAPQDAGMQDTLGWLLLQRGQADAALRHLREARLRAPRNPEIRYHLAVALAQAGRQEEALAELSSLLQEKISFDGVKEARALLEKLSSR